MNKTGVLLCNLGGPTNLSEVRPFLFRLFSDPDILVGIPFPLRQLLAGIIVLLKGPSSIAAYKKIGGGSPQAEWTRKQAAKLSARLEGIPVSIGMRAWKPTLKDGLKELQQQGVDSLIILPLFPQYSTTTTGSCFKEIQRILSRMQRGSDRWSPKVRWIKNYPDHPKYIELLKQTIQESLAKTNAPAHVLLSAHSLPLKIVERGDTYPRDVEQTVSALTKDLKTPWSLAFQSRNGPVPWLKPYVETEIPSLAERGVRSLVVVPLSFVSDHIETLFELDMEYKHLATESGITEYYRTRAFNDDDSWIDCLENLVKE